MTLAQVISGVWTLWGLITPRAIDRFRPAWIGIEFGLFLIAALFWLDTQRGGDSFSPETWGAWACQWPAEAWAAMMIVGSVLSISGLMHPVTRTRIIVGASVQVCHFFALSLSAMTTGGEFVIAVFALLFFVPMHIVLAWEAAIYEPCGNT